MAFTLCLAQMAASEDHEANVRKGLDLIARAAKAGAQAICYPELSFTPFFPQYRADPTYFTWAQPISGPWVERFQAAAREHRLVTAINLFERAGRGIYYDASVVIEADGALLGATRMLHIAEEPGFNEKYYYWPGDSEFTVYETTVGRLGIAICYDRHFPEVMRALTLGGAEVILTPFAGLTTDPMDFYVVEMQGCSFSNQVYIAAVNRVGKEGEMVFAGGSFVTDPWGRVIARAGNEEELLLAEIKPQLIEEARHRRPFLRDRRPELYGVLSQR